MRPMNREGLLRLRLMLLALGASLWALIIGVRLLHLQVLERTFFERQGARQSERTINLDPRRGSIIDRNGRPLALSVEAESIYAVPQDVEDPVRTAAAIAHVLGLDGAGRRDLVALLQRSRAFVWVKRKVDTATAQEVRALQLPGIGFLTETRRYYPHRELMSQVLGYVGLDNTGMSGIEYSFDEDIRGRAQKVVVQTDARRRPVGHTEKPSTEGRTVVLALDETLQFVAERELEAAVQRTEAVSGVVVVLDPWTGEVLAMASSPTFNPNRFSAYPSSHWRNRAVADAYEPGSIFKIVTAAAGLQEHVVGVEEVLDCGNGFIEVAGTRINDHDVFDKLTFRMAVARSSDIGMVRVAQRVGREQFARYVHDFGFGQPTGVDLPGESSGLVRPTNRWSALSLPTLAFGQELGVTALQMTLAAAAVANGGYLMKPIVVRRIEDAPGHIVKEFRPAVVRRVLAPDTTDTLTDILRTVVKEGTGRQAAISGFTVAGKTGTAQKIDATGHYSMSDHVASFVGFVPANQPAVVILVSLDSPRGLHNQGGDVAAPVFAKVADETLRYKAVPPEEPDRVLRVVSLSASAVVSAAYRSGTAARVQHARMDEPPQDLHHMPDLRGRSAREAALLAAQRGFIVELSGSGSVVEQTPPAGAEVESGARCRLVLAHLRGQAGGRVEAR